MTDYFYDTEFLEDGSTIELISIGIIASDGREYYAVLADCKFNRIRGDDWLWANVVRHLPTTKKDWQYPNNARNITELDRNSSAVKPKWVVANEVRDFILQPGMNPFDIGEPKLWAHYAAYDHVALCQLWGKMIDLPKGMPMWTHDLMQLMEPLEGFRKPAEPEDEHHALADARWAERCYVAAQDFINDPERSSRAFPLVG